MSIQTIILSYKSDQQHVINCLQKQLSNATRYAYNRSIDGWNQTQTKDAIKTLYNISSDSYLNQCAVINGFNEIFMQLC